MNIAKKHNEHSTVSKNTIVSKTAFAQNARVGNGTHAAAAPRISCLFARVNKLNTAEEAKVKANMIPIHIAVALPEKVPSVCVARW